MVAQETFAGRLPHCLTGDRHSILPYHVEIEQPPERMGVFYIANCPLRVHLGQRSEQECFKTGRQVAGFGEKHVASETSDKCRKGRACHQKRLGVALDSAGHDYGKGYQSLAGVLLLQLLLVTHPFIPAPEQIIKRDLHTNQA